jgi:hypothetical protein
LYMFSLFDGFVESSFILINQVRNSWFQALIIVTKESAGIRRRLFPII